MIPSHLHHLLAQARSEDLRLAAMSEALPARCSPPGHAGSGPPPEPVTLRFGFPDDREALRRLAALDSACPPEEPVLLAEVNGELTAALSLRDGSVVSDPFRPTVALIDLLHARAEQLRGPASKRRLVRPWLPIRLGAARR